MNKPNVYLNLKSFIPVITCFLFVGCKGAEGGFAPSLTTPVVTTLKSNSNLKNGSEIKIANGWELQLDTTDSVKNLTTSNGWKIEVKYE